MGLKDKRKAAVACRWSSHVPAAPPFRTSQRESKLFLLCPFQPGLDGKCKNKCDDENCCNKRILERQPDFCDRKSLVQEAIEAAGH
ncbi:hypothetical protein AZE42_10582, partial [Rhizopogon vesiculosus]